MVFSTLPLGIMIDHTRAQAQHILATAHNGVVAQHNGGCFGQCTVVGDNGAVEWFLMGGEGGQRSKGSIEAHLVIGLQNNNYLYIVDD
jgi:hypothetical protein